jgi:mono/diheme cytochrome c family protein
MNRSLFPVAQRMSSWCLVAVAAVASLAGASCKLEKPKFNQASCGSADPDVAHWCAPRTFAGGITADATALEDGYEAYMLYCYTCHGEKGDGKGPSSYGYRPPPRDFTAGIFKFARLRSSDELPNDEDLYRIVRGGLHGTPMLPWAISGQNPDGSERPDGELAKIIQYIKTFAPQKWEKKKKNGDSAKTLEGFALPADPWASKDVEAVARGRDLYHFKAECATCHPSYGTKDELYKLSIAANKREPEVFKPLTGFRLDPYGSVAKDSSEYKVRILPPDFTFSEVRSIRDGREMEDLFRVISYGVYPIMPAWKDAIEDKDIWAIAHYVKSLLATRNSHAAATLRDKQNTQASFEVPKPEEPKPEPVAATTLDGGAAAATDAGAAATDAGAPKKAPAPAPQK